MACSATASLLRLQLTLLLLETSAPAYAAALLVYAFGRGGASAAGLVMVATMAPAAVAAPFAAMLVDRLPRERVLVAAAAARGLLLAVAAVLICTGAPAVSTYTVAAVASIVARIGFPARAALLPDVTRSDEELAAANSLGGVIESAASVAGPRSPAGCSRSQAQPPPSQAQRSSRSSRPSPPPVFGRARIPDVRARPAVV